MASLQAAACLDPSTDWLQGIIQDERHVDSPNFEELMISCSTRSPLEIVVEGSGSVAADHQRSGTRPQPADQLALKCPRCDSTHTKFCYYNNYSLSQPRYFCKTCRRYWTKGGSLRNVPVGGGCRKNKRSSSVSSSSSAAKKHIINIDPVLQPALNNIGIPALQYPYKMPNITTDDHNPKNLNLSNYFSAGGGHELLTGRTHRNQLDSASSLFRNFNGFSLLGHEFSIGEVGGSSCYGSQNSIDPSGYPIDGLATRININNINLGFDQANCDDKGDDDHDQYDEIEIKPKITNLFDDRLSSLSSIKGDGDSIKRINLTLEWEDKINGNGQDDHDHESTDHSSSGAQWRTLSSFGNSYGLYSL